MKHINILLKIFFVTILLLTSCTGDNPVEPVEPEIGSWQLAGSGLPEGAGVSGLAINSNGVIFAGLDWIGSGCDQCGGVYRSTDDGGTWSQLSWGYRERQPWVDAVAINSKNEVFVTNGRVKRSSDNGDTWERLDTFPILSSENASGHANELEINNNDQIFVTIGFGGFLGVYRSTDNGNTWPLTALGRVRSIAINSKNDIFGVTEAGHHTRPVQSLLFLHHSTDNGETITRIKVVNADVDDFGHPKIAINSNDDIFVFVGTYSLSHSSLNMFLSFDNGKNWNKARLSGLFTPVTAIAFNKNNDIFVGSNTGEIGTEEVNYSSVYRSNDNGGHWVNTGLTIHAGWFSSLAFDSKGNLFAGTNGNFDISRVFMLPAAIAN